MSEWTAEKLRVVAEINPKEKVSSANREVSFIAMSALDAEATSVSSTESRRLADFAKKGYTSFRNGDILLAKITPCFENGKIAQVSIRHAYGLGSTEFHVIRPQEGRLNSRYALHFLRLDQVRKQGIQRMTGSAGQKRVPQQFFFDLTIPLPPLAEQQRIAEVLDRADALRAKRRAALAQLDELTQSIFLEMFGDPAQNPRNIPSVRLGDLGTWRSGGTPPRNRPRYFAGKIPWYSSGELGSLFAEYPNEHISAEALGETSAKLVERGSLMLGMYDTAALKSSIASQDCSCNQAIAFAQIRPDVAEPMFVYYTILFGRDTFRSLQRGVRQKNLNLSMIRAIRIPMPDLDLQREFVAKVRGINNIIGLASDASKVADSLFASLQHRAFRGEL